MLGHEPFIYYNPETGRCGDFIPFYWEEEYHLFHLNLEPWYHISTRDFVNFIEYGAAIPSGGLNSQDRDIYTGCVIEKEGTFYIFYTGNNADFADNKRFMQVIMRATSSDLIHWTKDIDWELPPDPDKFARNAWRDPHVFWNGQAEEYWMVLTAQEKNNFSKRYGCTVLYTSKDLTDWAYKKIIYSPELFDTHECPDLFQIGDWWYLVYSTYSHHWETRYRMAKNPVGPWIAPADDLFEGRTFYAAKTAGDGKRRLLFGWVAVKDEEIDANKYLWGGNLITHELVQREDGTLGVKLPLEIETSFDTYVVITPESRRGNWRIEDKKISVDSLQQFSYLHLCEMPENCIFKCKVQWETGTRAFGMMLRSDNAALEQWYQVRIEPGSNRVVFDRANRFFVDQTFIEERKWNPNRGNTVELKVIAYGSIYAIFLDDQIALTARGYDYKSGTSALFVEEGQAAFFDYSAQKFSTVQDIK